MSVGMTRHSPSLKLVRAAPYDRAMQTSCLGRVEELNANDQSELDMAFPYALARQLERTARRGKGKVVVQEVTPEDVIIID